ncbi:MAG: DNA polymerase III subunit gamma/tau [Ignavibacteria bacterium]|nr:DNA polymerase III subunit gamma/tau [Ignavibacteria bacterium]
MSYLVTARKWRPNTFEDVVGQEHVTKTLQNAIAQNRIAHAYIFSGPRGCGKTTSARLLAKAINCESRKGFNPCNKCSQCLEITEGRSVDVFEIDGASNRGIDEIRDLRETVRYNPTRAKYKVYIIDEVHMLTPQAFNALLKTLEEPPPYLLFIFATTEIQKVPATILSRCQRFDFRRNSIEEITLRLQFIASEEKISIDDEALLIIAKKSDGSMRDSQSIFDQLIALCGKEIAGEQVRHSLNIVDQELYFKITDCIIAKDISSGLKLVEEIVEFGYDFREMMRGLIEHFRNLLVVATTHSTKLLEMTEEYKKRYETLAAEFSEGDILRYLKLAIELENDLRFSPVPRFRIELGLAQMIKMEKAISLEQLLSQLEELKKSNSTSVTKEPSNKYSTISSSSLFEKRETRYASPSLVMEPPMKLAVAKEPSVGIPGTKPTSALRTEISLAESNLRQTLKPISLSEISSQWQNIVSEVQKERRWIGTVLSESKVVQCDNGLVTLGCTNKAFVSSLKQNQDVVSATLEKIYGMKFRLETIMMEGEKGELETVSSPQETEHPFIETLKRELGAVEVI